MSVLLSKIKSRMTKQICRDLKVSVGTSRLRWRHWIGERARNDVLRDKHTVRIRRALDEVMTSDISHDLSSVSHAPVSMIERTSVPGTIVTLSSSSS